MRAVLQPHVSKTCPKNEFLQRSTTFSRSLTPLSCRCLFSCATRHHVDRAEDKEAFNHRTLTRSSTSSNRTLSPTWKCHLPKAAKRPCFSQRVVTRRRIPCKRNVSATYLRHVTMLSPRHRFMYLADISESPFSTCTKSNHEFHELNNCEFRHRRATLKSTSRIRTSDATRSRKQLKARAALACSHLPMTLPPTWRSFLCFSTTRSQE